MKDVLVFDTETTGLPPKGAKYDTDWKIFPHIVSLSWSINGNEKDLLVRPNGYEIPKEATEIHGITQEKALLDGIPLNNVLAQFIQDAKGARKIVGHNLYFDTSVIKANLLRDIGGKNPLEHVFYKMAEEALDKSKRVCTMMKTIKFVGAKMEGSNRGKFPSLEELYFKIFACGFQAHNSLEDVRAVIKCLPELEKQGLIDLS